MGEGELYPARGWTLHTSTYIVLNTMPLMQSSCACLKKQFVTQDSGLRFVFDFKAIHSRTADHKANINARTGTYLIIAKGRRASLQRDSLICSSAHRLAPYPQPNPELRIHFVFTPPVYFEPVHAQVMFRTATLTRRRSARS